MEIWVPECTSRRPAALDDDTDADADADADADVHVDADARPGRAARVSCFGGVAEGLSPERCPVCAECGETMSLQPRLASGPCLPRLPAEQVMLVFKCKLANICECREPDRGANACPILSLAELDSPQPLPADVVNGVTRIMPRLWVRAWRQTDDGFTLGEAATLQSYEEYVTAPDTMRPLWE